MAPNEETVRYGNEEGGVSWVEESDRFDGQLVPFTEALLALARPEPGERVLDVGCGGGALTLCLGEAAAPDGAVLGVDVSEPLVRLAQQRAAEAGAADTTFLVADAQVADLAGHGPFDLLVRRFGVMFFDDPVAAFTNLRRATADGGRVAFVCWQGYGANPWMSVPMSAALEHLPPPPPVEPDAPGPWAFADDDRVRRILDQAGFADVRVEALEGELLLAGGGDAEQAYEFLKATSLGRTLLLQDDPDVAGRVQDAVLAALQEHEVDGDVRFGFASWLVSARARG